MLGDVAEQVMLGWKAGLGQGAWGECGRVSAPVPRRGAIRGGVGSGGIVWPMAFETILILIVGLRALQTSFGSRFQFLGLTALVCSAPWADFECCLAVLAGGRLPSDSVGASVSLWHYFLVLSWCWHGVWRMEFARL